MTATEFDLQGREELMDKACVVLPTYNEIKNVDIIIPLVFEQAQKFSLNLHILVVDDNSPDGTQNAVKKLMQEYPNLHLITGEKKGLGDAYERGMAYAMEALNADIIIEMDADLQHDPALIPIFISRIYSGYSLVIGSRFAPGGSTPNFSLRRRLLSLVGNSLIRVCAGLPQIYDCTSGYRCIKAELIKKCSLSSLPTRGYSFQAALLYNLVKNGARVIEEPITFPERVYGKSKLSFQDQIEFLLFLIHILFQTSNEFIKYSLVGASGVLVNMSAYILLTRSIKIPMAFAAPVAIELSILSNFMWNNFWTFKRRNVENNLLQKLLCFHIVAGWAAITNYAILIFLVQWCGFWDIGANLIGITAAVIINYVMNSHWTWKEILKKP